MLDYPSQGETVIFLLFCVIFADGRIMARVFHKELRPMEIKKRSDIFHPLVNEKDFSIVRSRRIASGNLRVCILWQHFGSLRITDL